MSSTASWTLLTDLHADVRGRRIPPDYRERRLQASIAKVARKFSNRFYIFIPMLTLIFTLIATNQGVNLFIPFVPITVMLSFALGLDSLVGVSIILLGGAVGFSTGTLQTSTTLLAQEIAGLVPFSGSGTAPSAWWCSGSSPTCSSSATP